MPNINLKTYKPIKDELYMDRIKNRLLIDPTYYRCFNTDRTNQFLSVFRNIVDGKKGFIENMIIQMSGGTGSGKSLSVLSLCKLIYGKNFSYKNIFFFDQQILDNVEKFPRNTCLIRDENPANAIFGTGSKRVSGQIRVLNETTRKYGLSLIFVEPSFQNIEVAKYYLETVDMGACEGQRVVRCGLRDSYTLKFIGCVLIPVVNETHPDWVKYNEIKDKFIDMVRKQDYTDAKLNPFATAKHLLKTDPEINNLKNSKQIRLYVESKFPYLTKTECDNITTAIRIQKDKEERGDVA